MKDGPALVENRQEISGTDVARAGVDLDKLSQWMDDRGLGGGALTDVTLLTGGTQNILLQFTRGGRIYVLRRPPLHLRANSNETMRREMRVLGALASTDVPHPRLIAASPEEDVLGVAFYLMEKIEGINLTVDMPEPTRLPENQRRMGLSFIDAAAALASVHYRAIGLEGFGKTESFLERQVPRWQSQLASYATMPGWPGPEGLPDVEAIARWLDRHRPSSFLPGIMHGDYHLANVMFKADGSGVAAIIDWELSSIGDPMIDLGWALAGWPDAGEPHESVLYWNGFPERDELVARYAQSSGRDVSHADWYGVFACFKLAILLEGTYARACAGKADAKLGEQFHQNSVNLLERAARWMR